MNNRPVNVANTERAVAALLAGVVLVRSLRTASPIGLIAAGCLIYRAVSGHCYGYEWLGVSTCHLRR